VQWSLKQSKLDILFEHRPVSKIANVVALSGHIGTVMLNNCLGNETILQKEMKDIFRMDQTPGSYFSKI
jgi:hypothetical protein